MKLNELEFALMNNPIRALSQRRIETPLLIGRGDVLARKRVLEVGCGRGVGMEILLSLGAAHVTGFDLDPRMVTQARKRTAKYADRAHAFVGDAEAIDVPRATCKTMNAPFDCARTKTLASISIPSALRSGCLRK